MSKKRIMDIMWLMGVGLLVFRFLSTIELPRDRYAYSIITLAGYFILFVWAVISFILKSRERAVLVEGIVGFILTIISTPHAGRVIPEVLRINENILAFFLHAVSIMILIGPAGSIFRRKKNDGPCDSSTRAEGE